MPGTVLTGNIHKVTEPSMRYRYGQYSHIIAEETNLEKLRNSHKVTQLINAGLRI